MPEERILTDRRSGWEQLSAYEPALRRYFRKRAPASIVDDLVQDVFTSLYARQSPAPVEDLERYLFTVAAHALHHRTRRDRRWEYLEDRDDCTPMEEISPERQVSGREQLSNAIAVISNLSPRTRQVFILHRFEEMTYRSIATALGISVSAVEKHMMAALRALASSIEPR